MISILFLTFSCSFNEELESENSIKSIKAYYFDEYGDQGERNGDLTLEVNLSPDGTYANVSGFHYKFHNVFKSTMGFIQWDKEVDILAHGERWPEVKKQEIEKSLELHLEWQNKDNVIITKYAPKIDTFYTSVRTLREVDSRGYEVVKVESFDDNGRIWSTSIIDSGELYEYDEFGRIKVLKRKYFDSEAFSNRNQENDEGIMVTTNVGKYTRELSNEFIYNDQGNLVSSHVDNKLNKSFEYDENNKLTKISRFKNEEMLSNYQLFYNVNGDISKVQAFNRNNEIEFTMKYEYEYY